MFVSVTLGSALNERALSLENEKDAHKKQADTHLQIAKVLPILLNASASVQTAQACTLACTFTHSHVELTNIMLLTSPNKTGHHPPHSPSSTTQ